MKTHKSKLTIAIKKQILSSSPQYRCYFYCSYYHQVFQLQKTRKIRATCNTGSRKFSPLRLILFVNDLTDFETGFRFCKSLRMLISERSLNSKCYSHISSMALLVCNLSKAPIKRFSLTQFKSR